MCFRECIAHGSHKRALDSLELGLYVLVSISPQGLELGPENRTLALCKSSLYSEAQSGPSTPVW